MQSCSLNRPNAREDMDFCLPSLSESLVSRVLSLNSHPAPNKLFLLVEAAGRISGWSDQSITQE